MRRSLDTSVSQRLKLGTPSRAVRSRHSLDDKALRPTMSQYNQHHARARASLDETRPHTSDPGVRRAQPMQQHLPQHAWTARKSFDRGRGALLVLVAARHWRCCHHLWPLLVIHVRIVVVGVVLMGSINLTT